MRYIYLLFHLLAATTITAYVLPSFPNYTLKTSYTPDNFFSQFDFSTDPDPTCGHVQYLPYESALSSDLIHASNTSIYLGADHTYLAPHGQSSVRLESKERYTKGLFILDVDHIPYGCGVWPAFWTYAHPWPSKGEIDIIEGVHEQSSNSIVVHTPTDLCTCPPSTLESLQTGYTLPPTTPAVNQYVKIKDPRGSSYGSLEFAGGVYAMEWTGEFIKVWFFPRGEEPEDVVDGTPTPSDWGKPVAWVPVECGMEKWMSGHRLVFNITFCGEWAGLESVWEESGCKVYADTCERFVTENPEKFEEAYWRINSLMVWSMEDEEA